MECLPIKAPRSILCRLLWSPWIPGEGWEDRWDSWWDQIAPPWLSLSCGPAQSLQLWRQPPLAAPGWGLSQTPPVNIREQIRSVTQSFYRTVEKCTFSSLKESKSYLLLYVNVLLLSNSNEEIKQYQLPTTPNLKSKVVKWIQTESVAFSQDNKWEKYL